jgi:drug/metabolite transporter (DMT)-like permease
LNPFLPVLVMLGASTLWGLTWIPLKHFASFGVQGVLVTLVGHGSVGALAAVLLLLGRRRWWASRRTLAWLTGFGGLANVCFASAMSAGDVTRVMALFYLLPMWGVLGGRFLLGEGIDLRRRLSLGVAVLGAFLILGGPSVLDSPPGWIDFVSVLAGFALAMNNVLFRKLQAVSVADKVGASFVGCLLWAAALVIVGPDAWPTGVPPHLYVEVVAFGGIWILLATLGTLFGVHHLEAGRSSVLIVMELVTAVVSAALLSGRVPRALEWCGAGLILLAALLEGYRPEPDLKMVRT